MMQVSTILLLNWSTLPDATTALTNIIVKKRIIVIPFGRCKTKKYNYVSNVKILEISS